MTLIEFLKSQVKKTIIIHIGILFIGIFLTILENNLYYGIKSIFLLILMFNMHEFVHYLCAKFFSFTDIRNNEEENNLGIIYEARLMQNLDYFKVIITSLFPVFLNITFLIFSVLLFYYKTDSLYILLGLVNFYFIVASVLAGDDFRIIKDYYFFTKART